MNTTGAALQFQLKMGLTLFEIVFNVCYSSEGSGSARKA